MIAVYSGEETIYVGNIEGIIKKLKIPCQRVRSADIVNNKIKDCSLLIVPGGLTEKIISKLSKKGYKNIKRFVRGGGCYIGICAGAYLASEKVELPYGKHMEGLGLFKGECKRESEKRKRGMLKVVNIVKKCPITEGFSGKVEGWYLNGPLIKAGKGAVLAEYNNGDGAAVFSEYGKGKVILFSFHPEKRRETSSLLGNAILFGLEAKK
jgi:glutamine amidotransferase-like uncharacterized protein